MKKLYRVSFPRAAAISVAVLIVGGARRFRCCTDRHQRLATSLGSNPLAVESPLPYHAPRFDLIRNEHYEPAIEEGMKQELAEIDVIAKQMQLATFDNTIVPMERSGALLSRANRAFSVVVGTNTNDTLQKINQRLAPKLAAHNDAILLNDQLFKRIQHLYERRDAGGHTPEQKRLIERYYRNFVRAGAQLSEAEKIQLRALNQEFSKLSTDFANRVLSGTRASALVVSDRSELEGLSEAEIAAAAEAAKARGLTGKWVIPLQNTTQQPAQVSLRNRATRQRLFEAVDPADRARRHQRHEGDRVAHRAVRAEQRNCSDIPTFAAYHGGPRREDTRNAIKLLTDLVPPMTARARSEVAKMQSRITAEGGNFKLAPWDWQYYAEQVRKAKYDLDESLLKPYFEADTCSPHGVFFAANRLYGLTFNERKDIPTWLSSRCEGVRGVRGQRDAAGPLLRRFLQARQQAWRRVDEHFRDSVGIDGDETGGVQRVQLHQGGGRTTRAAQPARRQDDVSRVRARAARDVLARRISDVHRHQCADGISSSSLPR